MTVTSGSNQGSSPVITRVKIKKSKKLFVYGTSFTTDCIIILNGFVLPPKSLTREGGVDRLLYKGSIPVGAAGTNTIFVQNNSNRSAAFFF